MDVRGYINIAKDDPKLEGYKDLARIVFFFIVAWIATQILGQLEVIPVSYDVNIWEFVFQIPIRATVSTVLTALLTYIDRIKFLNDGKGLTFGK